MKATAEMVERVRRQVDRAAAVVREKDHDVEGCMPSVAVVHAAHQSWVGILVYLQERLSRGE